MFCAGYYWSLTEVYHDTDTVIVVQKWNLVNVHNLQSCNEEHLIKQFFDQVSFI